MAVFVIAMSVILRVFVVGSFVDLENKSALNNVGRLLNAVTERTMSINSKASDWSAWDDAYQFMQDGNSHFIRSNIVLSAFTGNNLNLIVYIRNSGEIVCGQWYQPGSRTLVPIPEDIRRAIDREGPITSHRDAHSSVSGIVMIDQGPMLITSRPVVTSDEKGPIRGTLIFGQLLDSKRIQDLSRIIKSPIVVMRLDKGRLPTGFAEARADIIESRKPFVKPLSRRKIAGYTILDDIYGKPALLLRVTMPRSLYSRGLALANYTLAALAILSIISGAIANLLLIRTFKKEQEFDLKTREFYRRTITAATDGKLIVTDPSEIEKLGSPLGTQWDIRVPADLVEARDKVFNATSSAGIEEERAWNFATGVGEAVTNAMKHAGGGIASLHRTPDGLLFVISDPGSGIPTLTLPDIALLRGYSTAGTLGMGYKIMIALADRVYLATGPKGTTVAIEIKLQPAEPSFLAMLVE